MILVKRGKKPIKTTPEWIQMLERAATDTKTLMTVFYMLKSYLQTGKIV